jgi:hypothetical protein
MMAELNAVLSGINPKPQPAEVSQFDDQINSDGAQLYGDQPTGVYATKFYQAYPDTFSPKQTVELKPQTIT